MVDNNINNTKDIDDIANEIDELLCSKTLEELNEIIIKLNIHGVEVEGKKKRHVKSIITKYYESILDEVKEEEEIKTDLLNIITLINNNTTTNKEQDEQKQVEDEQHKDVNKVIATTSTDDSSSSSRTNENAGNINPLLRELGLLKKTSLLRRDLKIRGHCKQCYQSYESFTHFKKCLRNHQRPKT